MAGIICNASPLIVVAKADLLWVVPKLFDTVLIPSSVAQEINQGPEDDPMRRGLPETPWLRQVRVEPPLPPLAVWQLGPGESEVIEYARLHPGLAVLLDDRAGRHAALALKLKVYGTLAVLALAVKKGEVSSFRKAAEALVMAGFRISPSLVDEISRELGE
jgi:predicted nucleic acid-binding protein